MNVWSICKFFEESSKQFIYKTEYECVYIYFYNILEMTKICHLIVRRLVVFIIFFKLLSFALVCHNNFRFSSVFYVSSFLLVDLVIWELRHVIFLDYISTHFRHVVNHFKILKIAYSALYYILLKYH